MEHPHYNQSIHGPYEFFEVGDLALEDGGVLRDVRLAYATFGTLNADKDNAVLITTWYGGTSKIFETTFIGPGHALDPARWFIIVVNQLGNGLSSSPLGAAQLEDGFSCLRIGDDVCAQHRLVTEKFGISRLALVCGGSMGAQQTYEWAVRFPHMVARAAPFCGTARSSDYNQLMVGRFIDAITSDPAWNQGRYAASSQVHVGLRRHARQLAITGFSADFYRRQLWRGLGFTCVDDFVGQYLEGFLVSADPNVLLCMARKWQRADVSRRFDGDLGLALGRVTAKTFVMPIDEDMLFPPVDCEAERKLIPGSELRVLHSPCGHSACTGMDPDWMPQFDRHVGELLALPA
jgi:homoserine O-acetyltransferase